MVDPKLGLGLLHSSGRLGLLLDRVMLFKDFDFW